MHVNYRFISFSLFLLISLVGIVFSNSDLPPRYSLNSTNSTLAGTPISHNLYWEDDNGLSGYIFSFCNGTYLRTTPTTYNWTSPDLEPGITQFRGYSTSPIYYINFTNVLRQSASTTQVEYLSLTWTPEPGSKYLVLAYMEGNSSSTTIQQVVRVFNNSHMLAYYADRARVANTEILPYFFAIIQDGWGTPVRYNITFSSSTTTAVGALRAILAAIRIDNLPNSHFNFTYNATEGADVNNVWGDQPGHDTDTIVLNVPTTGDYLIIASAKLESDSTTGAVSYRVNLNNGAEFIPYGVGTFTGDFNYSLYIDTNVAEEVSFGIVAVRRLSAGTHVIRAQVADGDATASADWQYRSLIAIRLSDSFTYFFNSTTLQASTTSTTYQNYTTLNVANNPGNYIVLAGISKQGTSTSYNVDNTLWINGIIYSMISESPFNVNEYRARAMLQNVTLDSDSWIATQYRTSNTAATARVKNSDILALSLNGTNDIERNTSWKFYENIGGSDYQNVDSVVIITTIDYYNPSASNSTYNRNNRPDLEIGVWNGSTYVSGFSCRISDYMGANLPNSTDWNCSITITDSSILNAWKSSGNRRIQVRGIWIDSFNANIYDEINVTNVYVLINAWNSTTEVRPCSDQNAILTNDTWTPFQGSPKSAWTNVTKVVTSQVGATIKWCVYVNDTFGNWNSTSCVSPFTYTTRTNQAPILGERTENPTSPTVYERGKKYTFSIVVNDPDGDNDISQVIFEFNGQNETVNTYQVVNSTARRYSVEKYDLAAGPNGYVFKWYAVDRPGFFGNVVTGTYVINKATSIIALDLASGKVNYPTEVFANCYVLQGDQTARLELYRNGTFVAFGSGTVSERKILGVGSYNYTCYYLESQNYTSSSVERFLTVEKGTPPIFLEINGIQNNYTCYYPTLAKVVGWLETLNEEGEVKLYRNGYLVGSGELVSEEILLPAGEYNYTLVFEETANYTSRSITWFLIVRKGISNATLYFIPASPVVYGTSVTAFCIEDNPEAEGRLWRNGSDVTHENGTSIVLPAGVWHYTCNVSETQNYTSASNYSFYIVNKAPTEIRLFLNGTEGNVSYVYEDYANITAVLNVSNKIIFIETNFTGLNQILAFGESFAQVITSDFGAGVYNITAYWSGDQNYTGSSKTYFMFVSKKPTTLYLWINGSRENKTYYSSTTLNFTVELLNYIGRIVELWSNYSDGSPKLISSGQSPHQFTLSLSQNGIFNFTGFYPGNANYSSSSETWIVRIGKMNAMIEELNPNVIGENKSAILAGSCECLYVECTNLYLEAQADGKTIPTTPDYNLSVNGTNPYFVQSLSGKRTVVWNLTGHRIGEYKVRIKCNSTEFPNVYSNEMRLQVVDEIPPVWKNNLTYPQQPVYYAQNQRYQFNITWLDNVGLSQVLIEHNFTSIPLNESMEREGYRYYYTIYDLPAGVYRWKSYARDTYGNWNSTPEFIYKVERAPTKISIYLNGSEEDRTYEVFDRVNITVEVNVSGKRVYLASNMSDWVVQSSVTPLFNITLLKRIGAFNLTGYFEGDQNYTSSSLVRFLRVVDSKPPILVYVNQSRGWIGVNETIYLYANWSDNYELDYAWLSVNDTGSWRNLSYVKLNLQNRETWSNFTWRNSSIPAGFVIGWRVYANDTSGNERYSSIFTFSVNASMLWNFTTSGRIYSSPAVGDVNDDGEIDVVFASLDRNVYVVRGKDGLQIFNFTTNGSITSSPSLAHFGGERHLRIFVGSYDFNVYAINGSNGQKIWNFSTQGRVFSSPALGDVNGDNFLDIVIGSDDGRVYAINSSDGKLLWYYQTNGRVVSSPAIRKIGSTTYVFVGSYDFNVYAINGSNGQKIWNFSTQEKVESSPLVDDFDRDGYYEVVVGSYDNQTYVLDALTGSKKWSYKTGNRITASPITLRILNDRKIVISSSDSKLYCFNPDGSINWTFTIPTSGRAPYLPSSYDSNNDGINDVIFGATDGILYVVDGLTGRLIWFYRIGQYIYSSPAISDLNGDGTLDITFGSFDSRQYTLDPPSWNMFGGNERSTRIYDSEQPRLLFYSKEVENCSISFYSRWKDFSNLKFAYVVLKNEFGTKNDTFSLSGTEAWINYTFYSCRKTELEIFVIDEYDNVGSFSDFIEVEEEDRPPLIEIVKIPQQNITYSPGTTFEFWAKVIDDKGLSLVQIEHNFRGVLKNESMFDEGEIFAFNVSDLKVGEYMFRIHVIDASGNFNSSEWYRFFISKSPPVLFFNISRNIAEYLEEVRFVCEVESGENSKLKVVTNDLLVGESLGKRIEGKLELPAGRHEVRCLYEESENYTSGQSRKLLRVDKISPKISLRINGLEEDLIGECPFKVLVEGFSSNFGDNDVVYKLYMISNKEEVLGSGKNITFEKTLLTGDYLFKLNSTEGQNYTSFEIVRSAFVMDKTRPENVFYNKRYVSGSLVLSSRWKDSCVGIKRGIVRENSNGEREHSIQPIDGWVNYTIRKEDLTSFYGCRWIFNFICVKDVDIEIRSYDYSENVATLKDRVTLIFIRFFGWLI
ncbi:MAG: PQQ-binding-like beta-propeller repeat protein [Candidatus Aenigmarchaeota archaeon]|nr:PQQ-binding-like beta-propeller repeat protein [Candidatus Aenigmarchaeota archaeon]MDW8160207.1 PQQ-binding-like beta-propeller repeat protein [Candidatus Aenigmarchaeota archaeon]